MVDVHALGTQVAFTTGYADLGWARGVFRDDFFWHRVDRHDVDTSGLNQLEAQAPHGTPLVDARRAGRDHRDHLPVRADPARG